MTQSSNAIPVSGEISDAELARFIRRASLKRFALAQQATRIALELQTLRATKGELVEALKERNEMQLLFDMRWAASMRAIKGWQEAHPGNDLVWPDSAELDVWALEQADAAVTLLTDAAVALKPFADYAPYVSMFVQGRAAQGGSPILPTKHFRKLDFERAAEFIAALSRSGVSK